MGMIRNSLVISALWGSLVMLHAAQQGGKSPAEFFNQAADQVTEATKVIGKLDAEVWKLDGEIGNYKKLLKQGFREQCAQSYAADLEQERQNLKKELDARYNTVLADQQSKMSQFDKDLERLNTENTRLTEQNVALEKTIKKLKKNQNNIEQLKADHAEKMAATDKVFGLKLKELEQEITTLKKQKSELSAQLAQKTTVPEIKKELVVSDQARAEIEKTITSDFGSLQQQVERFFEEDQQEQEEQKKLDAEEQSLLQEAENSIHQSPATTTASSLSSSSSVAPARGTVVAVKRKNQPVVPEAKLEPEATVAAANEFKEAAESAVVSGEAIVKKSKIVVPGAAGASGPYADVMRSVDADLNHYANNAYKQKDETWGGNKVGQVTKNVESLIRQLQEVSKEPKEKKYRAELVKHYQAVLANLRQLRDGKTLSVPKKPVKQT